MGVLVLLSVMVELSAGQRQDNSCRAVWRTKLCRYYLPICLSFCILNILNKRLPWNWWFPYEPVKYHRLSPNSLASTPCPFTHTHTHTRAVLFENSASHRDFSDSSQRITQVLSKEQFILLWVAIQISSYLNDSQEELAKKPEIKIKLWYSSISLFGAYFAFRGHKCIFNQK